MQVISFPKPTADWGNITVVPSVHVLASVCAIVDKLRYRVYVEHIYLDALCYPCACGNKHNVWVFDVGNYGLGKSHTYVICPQCYQEV